MTFPYRAGGQAAGVKQGEIWTDWILVGGSDPHSDETGWINSSGTDMVISGTNIFLNGTGTADIIVGTSISGTTIYSDGQILVGGSIRGVTSWYPQASIGSPATQVATLIQGGSGNSGAGSTVWMVFPTGFSQIPTVVATIAKVDANEDYTVQVGTIDEGSVQVYSIGAASQDFTWMAIGKP